MKRIRLLALLCAILMILSTASALAAPALPVRPALQRVMSWNNYALLKNKKTLQLYAWPGTFPSIADKKGNTINDILADVKASVTAKSSVDWITVGKIPPSFTIESIEPLYSPENRTGKITVTGKNFKGTIKITQFGRDEFTSAKRKKNKLTFKYALGGASLHLYTVYRGKIGTGSSTLVKHGVLKGSNKTGSVTIKLTKGYHYEVSIGPALKNKSYFTGYNSRGTMQFSFDVTDVTGTEEYTDFSSF